MLRIYCKATFFFTIDRLFWMREQVAVNKFKKSQITTL